MSHEKGPSAAPRPPERGDPVFDRLTRLTCRVFGALLALVVLRDGDRHVLTSQYGLTPPSARTGDPPVDLSFCQAVAARQAGLAVEDTRASFEWADHAGIGRLDQPSGVSA